MVEDGLGERSGEGPSMAPLRVSAQGCRNIVAHDYDRIAHGSRSLFSRDFWVWT